MSTLKETTGSQAHPDSALPSRPTESALDKQVGGNHYSKLAIQPAEYCYANRIPFMEGCAIKYLTRWRDKGGIADLEKARHFIDMLIEFEERKPKARNPAAVSAVHSDAKTTTCCDESVHTGCPGTTDHVHRWTWNSATGDTFCGVCLSPKVLPMAPGCPVSPNGEHHRVLKSIGNGFCLHCNCQL
jgi:hypothetical protein